MNLQHQSGEIVGDRYQTQGVLGQGGIAVTYQALDKITNTKVALKVLSLHEIDNWKSIELFEREAQILQ